MRFTALASVALCLTATQPLRTTAFAQARTADVTARGLSESDFPRMTKLADGVYAYEALDHTPKFTTVSLIVIGSRGVLIADGQGSPAATQAMVDAIRTLTPLPLRWYVVGSDHGDHTAGNSVLPRDIRYIVQANSLAQLKRDSVAAVGSKRMVVVPPAAMTSDSETVDVGGRRVVVRFLGRAHTGGDLTAEVPDAGILFMSEAYLNRVFPAMRSAYPSDWVRVVNRALAMPGVRRFVAGHGCIENPAASREELLAFRDALAAVNAEVKRLHDAGVPVEEAVKRADWGQYGSWMLAAQQGPVAVRKGYDELDGKLK